MTRRIPILILLVLGAFAASATQRYELKVGDFSKLKVTSGINVDYRCSADSAGMVVFMADASMASCIGFTPRGDELKISFTSDGRPEGVIPTVTVYSRHLSQVSNTADSTVRVLSVEPCSEFRARQEGNGRVVVRGIEADRVSAKLMTGNGQVIVYGECREASLSMAGTGLIQADGLRAECVKVSAAGTGQIGCWPIDELIVRGAGSTTVYYRGEPRLKKRYAIGVKVRPMDQE